MRSRSSQWAGDELRVDAVAGHLVEGAVAGAAVEAPEAGVADVGEAEAELVAEEAEQPEDLVGIGFRFSVFGAHNSDVAGLIGRARAQAEKEIGRQYLEPSSHRPGWVLRGDEVAGRLVWSGEGPSMSSSMAGRSPGRSLAWPSSSTRAVGSGS